VLQRLADRLATADVPQTSGINSARGPQPFKELTREKRPQEPHGDGRDWKFVTAEHGGAEPNHRQHFAAEKLHWGRVTSPAKGAPRSLAGAGDVSVEAASQPVMRLGGVLGAAVPPKRRRPPSASLSKLEWLNRTLAIERPWFPSSLPKMVNLERERLERPGFAPRAPAALDG
jgi:hypothetical protein